MEGKKISFGFMKTKKVDKPLVAVNIDEKKEYIECVEEKSIKVVGGEKVTVNEPLVIPLKPNTLVTAERLKEIAEKVESALEEPEIKQEPEAEANIQDSLVGNETLDEMAVRELMQESKKEVKTESVAMAIPTPAKTIADGEKESTLDDYEAVPIQQFGMAMLRGMGWTPSKDGSKYKQPELRPKGLGLGADKVIKQNKKKQASKDNKAEVELDIVKNAFVKVTTGKYSGYYGKVVSLDEENGRVMVDIPVKKETVSLSEFMMQAVTKSEYDKESKVINADSYEEYKKKELSQKSSRQEEKSSSSQRRDEREKERRDDKEKREEKDKERSGEKEKRDDREKERRDDKERRDEKEKRDDREKERRIDKERRDRQRETDSHDSRRQRDHDSANGKNRIRHRRDSSSSDERSSRKKKMDRKRYSSSDSLSSLSDDDRRQHKQSKHKSRRRRSRSRSNSRKKSPTPEGKRDIDKKRKGKKKKRDRDRSPNYKKHRK